MATSSGREPMDVTISEGNLYEHDRKRFKPLRAIRKMFRGKKKAKEFSKSTGSIYTGPVTSESLMPPSNLMHHSMSHESVFAPEGISSGTGLTSVRHALSADDIAFASIPVDRLKELDQQDGAKAMSIGSDVNLKTNGNDIDFDLDMNDISVNVSRLDNKAAYDKIALRPKRRTAKKARGAPQQHVIKVQAEINGFTDSSFDEDINSRDEAKDISPPQAKKMRPPSFLPPLSNENKLNPEEISSGTPKRHSMYVRSPLGPGPGIMVPSLADVQKVKLRKRTDEDKVQEKVEEKSPPKSKSDSKSTEKSKTSKKSETKKTPKQEQKNSSESGSSFFSWKNKTSTPKSPPLTRSNKDTAKENEKPKVSTGLFPSLKPVKKNSTEKDPKLNDSGIHKKETPPKKKTFGLGKRDKNRSGNNSKLNDTETVSESSVDIKVDEQAATKNERDSDEKEKVISDGRKMEIGTEKESKLEQIADDSKTETKKNRYAEKLKLDAAKLAESRVLMQEKPTSPKPFDDDDKKLLPLKSPNKDVGPDLRINDTPKIKIDTTMEVEKSQTPDISSPNKNTKNISWADKFTADKAVKSPDPTKDTSSFRIPVLKSISVLDKREEEVVSKKEILENDMNKKEENNSLTNNPSDQNKSKIVKKTTIVHSPNEDKVPIVTQSVEEREKTVAISPIETKLASPKVENIETTKDVQKDANIETKDQKPANNSNEPKTGAKSVVSESSGGMYSRNMLKHIGDKKQSQNARFSENIGESMKENLLSSPSRALRTRSFNVGTLTPTSEKPGSLKSDKIEEIAPKTRSFSQPPNPSPIREKLKLATKPPITPNKSIVITEEKTIQDAENNNVEPKDSIKEDFKTTETESQRPVPRRRNVKSENDNDGNDDNDVPAWVKLARRRSRVWEGGKKSNAPKTTGAGELNKDTDRPKSLAIASKSSRPESREFKGTTPTGATKTSLATSAAKTTESAVKTTESALKTTESAVKTTQSTVKTTKSAVKTTKSAVKTATSTAKTATTATSAAKTATSPMKPSRGVMLSPTGAVKSQTSSVKPSTAAKTPTTSAAKSSITKISKPAAKTSTASNNTSASLPKTTAKTVTPKHEERITLSEKSPDEELSGGQINRTASIPKINTVSPRRMNAPKQVTPPGQPSWLAIAMQKQKNWAKEETV